MDNLEHEHPLNAIIDNGRCNLGHEWDEGFNPDCALCNAVRDAIDVLIRDERGAVEALEQIVASWDDPRPGARQDVRYQEAVRLARATLTRLGGR